MYGSIFKIKKKNTDSVMMHDLNLEAKWKNYAHLSNRNRAIGLMSRVFTNGPGDQGTIPGRVMPKTQKMVLDAALLNTQHYKVRFKSKVKKSKERSCTLPYTSML